MLTIHSMDNSRSSGEYYYRLYWAYVLIRHHLTTGRKYALIKKYMLNKHVHLLTASTAGIKFKHEKIENIPPQGCIVINWNSPIIKIEAQSVSTCMHLAYFPSSFQAFGPCSEELCFCFPTRIKCLSRTIFVIIIM